MILKVDFSIILQLITITTIESFIRWTLWKDEPP